MPDAKLAPRPAASARGGRLRVLLVKPAAYDAEGRLAPPGKTFFPSRTLPYLAALTPPDVDVRIVDEGVERLTGEEDADLVALTAMLPNIPRAIDVARSYRRRGIPTALGGIGLFSLQDHVRESGAFDTLVLGEAEGVWPELIDDLARGDLKPTYAGGRPEDLAGLPTARYDLMNLKRYWRMPGHKLPFLAVETSRGCPHRCSFCAVRLFFGQKMRFRPVGDVVREIRELGTRYIIFSDDNTMADPERARELFTALKPLGIRWGGQFDVFAVTHPEVLALAGESGCRWAGVGVESLSHENLESVDKRQGTRLEVEEVAAGFRRAGISMTASMIFGLDHDTPESLEATVDRLIGSGVDILLPWTLTPGPGSPIYERLKAEGRILHDNYSLYNGLDVVFEPKHMTPEELAAQNARALRRFYRLRHVAGRALRARRKLDVLGMSLMFWNTARRGEHPFYSVT